MAEMKKSLCRADGTVDRPENYSLKLSILTPFNEPTILLMGVFQRNSHTGRCTSCTNMFIVVLLVMRSWRHEEIECVAL